VFRIRSFRGRVFAALLAVALVPTGVLVVTGIVALGNFGSTTGTLGPWEAVAESGRALIDDVRLRLPADAPAQALADEHGEALGASVRQSRLWAAMTRRVSSLLPLAAVLSLLTLAAIAALVARAVSKSLARPVRELVDWTERIGEGRPLPGAEQDRSGVREFRALRHALREASRATTAARDREVEAARLRAWTDMARTVAHELKNPLTPMRMSASSLARSADPQVRETAAILLEEVDRLDDMARSFSQFGRAPAGPPAPVDLSELLHALIGRYRDRELAISLDVRAPVPLIKGHHDLIERAVRNLLENALDAMRGDELPRIEVRLSGTRAGARIEVMDNGPGVPADLEQEIWMPNVTTRSRGSGLGLALVRRAAELHGGTATLLPSAKGAHFMLELPTDPDVPPSDPMRETSV
jgi:two-component system nitrogen regulation sensor histidine kinase NtrY